jgi:energy-coupling factor transporter ATP-binding protein EcfA2
MVLSVTDLSCARGAAQVLAGVSFSVSPGEALILRGPNGAGKTTLLRTLAGLTPPLRVHRLRAGRHRLCGPCRRAQGAADRGREPDLLGRRLRRRGTSRPRSTPSTCTTCPPPRGRDVGRPETPPVAGAPSGHGPPALVPRRAHGVARRGKRRPLRPRGRRRTWHRAARPSSRPISTSACRTRARST